MSKTAEETKVKKFLNKHGVGHLTKDLPSGHNVMNLIIEYTSELEKEIERINLAWDCDKAANKEGWTKVEKLEKEIQELKRELARYEIHDLKRK